MNNTLIPLHDLVVVEPEEVKQTKGGLIVPETAQRDGEAGRGTVLAAGPGRTDQYGAIFPMQVRPGNVVRYKPFAGTPIEHAGRKLRLMSELEVLAVERNEEYMEQERADVTAQHDRELRMRENIKKMNS